MRSCHLLRLSHPHNPPQNRVELVRSKTSSERQTKPNPSFLHLDYSCSSHGYTCSPMFLPLQRSNYCQNAMLALPAPVLASLKRPLFLTQPCVITQQRIRSSASTSPLPASPRFNFNWISSADRERWLVLKPPEVLQTYCFFGRSEIEREH